MTRNEIREVALTLAASTVTANLTDVQREDLAASFAASLRKVQSKAGFDPLTFYQLATDHGDEAVLYEALGEAV